jgi:fused signal recognition particle receptor
MFKFFKDKLKEWTKKVSSDKLGEEVKTKKKKAKKIKEEVAVEEEKEELLENSNELKELSNKKIILENRLENLEPSESNEDTIYLHQAKKGFFSKMLSSQVLFTEEDFSRHREDLEMLLLENNVAFDVVDKILVDFKN